MSWHKTAPRSRLAYPKPGRSPAGLHVARLHVRQADPFGNRIVGYTIYAPDFASSSGRTRGPLCGRSCTRRGAKWAHVYPFWSLLPRAPRSSPQPSSAHRHLYIPPVSALETTRQRRRCLPRSRSARAPPKQRGRPARSGSATLRPPASRWPPRKVGPSRTACGPGNDRPSRRSRRRCCGQAGGQLCARPADIFHLFGCFRVGATSLCPLPHC